MPSTKPRHDKGFPPKSGAALDKAAGEAVDKALDLVTRKKLPVKGKTAEPSGEKKQPTAIMGKRLAVSDRTKEAKKPEHDKDPEESKRRSRLIEQTRPGRPRALAAAAKVPVLDSDTLDPLLVPGRFTLLRDAPQGGSKGGGSLQKSSINTLTLSGLAISDIADLSFATSLYKLDVSQNSLRTPESLRGIQALPKLTYLSAKENELTDSVFSSLRCFPALMVLNLSHNKLTQLPADLAPSLPSLRALILSDNFISTLPSLAKSPLLNTIVLSNNPLEADALEKAQLPTLKELKKLSVARCALPSLPESLKAIDSLKELRMADNLVSSLAHVSPSLTVLEASNNTIKGVEALQALAAASDLYNVSLKGNPVAGMSDYRDRLTALCPMLRILDNERFDIKFLERKEKRKDVIEMKTRWKNKRERLEEERQTTKKPKLDSKSFKGSSADDAEAPVVPNDATQPSPRKLDSGKGNKKAKTFPAVPAPTSLALSPTPAVTPTPSASQSLSKSDPGNLDPRPGGGLNPPDSGVLRVEVKSRHKKPPAGLVSFDPSLLGTTSLEDSAWD